MSNKSVVYPGVNVFKCVCKDGSIFIPVSTSLMARLRCGETATVTGECHLSAHKKTFTLAAWPPFPRVRNRIVSAKQYVGG